MAAAGWHHIRSLMMPACSQSATCRTSNHAQHALGILLQDGCIQRCRVACTTASTVASIWDALLNAQLLREGALLPGGVFSIVVCRQLPTPPCA